MASRTTRALLAALALMLLVEPSNRLAASETTAHRVFQFGLKLSALDRLCHRNDRGLTMALPHFRLFRSDGALSWETTGYNPSFYSELKRRVKKGEATPRSWTLEDEVADFVAEDGSRVLPSRLPPADATFVAYWADWCAPCKTQIKDLRRFTEKATRLSTNILLVEADPSRLNAEMMLAACAAAD